MAKQYHYLNEFEQTVGPFSLERLEIMCSRGFIEDNTLVADDSSDWEPLSRVLAGGSKIRCEQDVLADTPTLFSKMPPSPNPGFRESNNELIKDVNSGAGRQSKQSSILNAQSALMKCGEIVCNSVSDFVDFVVRTFKKGGIALFVIAMVIVIGGVVYPVTAAPLHRTELRIEDMSESERNKLAALGAQRVWEKAPIAVLAWIFYQFRKRKKR